MISSVVARLESNSHLSQVCSKLEGHSAVELGPVVDGICLPLTLEAETPEELEDLHKWLRDQPGIEFVDVVCVYF